VRLTGGCGCGGGDVRLEEADVLSVEPDSRFLDFQYTRKEKLQLWVSVITTRDR
jgi:hypothetical protein